MKITVKTDLKNITAFRLELLKDPEPAAGRSGPLDQGHGRADRIRSGSRARRRSGARSPRLKFAKATADFNLPETPLEPIFYDKTGKTRVTGPIEFAIDGKDETAWGIDAGPGLRNQPRKAVFILATAHFRIRRARS